MIQNLKPCSRPNHASTRRIEKMIENGKHEIIQWIKDDPEAVFELLINTYWTEDVSDIENIIEIASHPM